jgi:hypothetical protein
MAFACDMCDKNDLSTYSLLLNINREKNPSKNVIIFWIGDR